MKFLALVGLLGISANFGIFAEEAAQPISVPYFGDPLPNLNESSLEAFYRGFSEFGRTWTKAEGLGPRFSADSCVSCHREPLPGGSGSRSASFVILSQDSHDLTDGNIFPSKRFSLEGAIEVLNPPSVHTRRRTPALFGIGLIELIPEALIKRRSDPLDSNGDGISGRVIETGNGIGRFGWKGNVPTIKEFVERAFITEMGLTSPRFPQGVAMDNSGGNIPEVSADKIQSVVEYLRNLAPPPRRDMSAVALEGKIFFKKIGCVDCHSESFEVTVKGKNLNLKLYSDLLVHDMGASLGDGLSNGFPNEFRTPPLWGIASSGPPYLHDGRAATLMQAITLHDGEARRSRDNFIHANSIEQNAITEFLRSL